MKILIVDDDPAALAISRAHLRKELLEVVCAEGGQAGVDEARRHRPDLILLDVDMPGMSGFEVLETLKNDPDLRMIPVIFLTGLGAAESLECGLDMGASDYVRKPFEGVELRARVRCALRMKHLQDMLAKQVNVDELTEILNRRGFLERLEQEWARVQRYGGVFAIVIGDVDHFKRINDSYGHPTGDRLLRQVAHVLASTCRQSDILGRYGGDEFVALFPNHTAGTAVGGAERFRRSIEAIRLSVPTGVEPVTASFGVADSRGHRSAENIIQEADKALYAAKQANRNCVETLPPTDSPGN